jgi:tetratricopeptide (TPR) repeat protein
VLYPPESETAVTTIIGPNTDDAVMWQNALTRNQQEVAKEPNNAFLWFNLGTIYNTMGDYEKAATAFDQARAIGLPWRMLWYQFGPYEAYYQVGRYDDIIILADVTLKDRPYFEEAYYYKGLARLALGDTNAARDNFERSANFNPLFQPAIDAIQQLGN